MDLFIVFATNFVFIFVKAFQQRNVTWMKYRPVLPSSFSMTVTQVYIWHTVTIRTMAGDSFLEMWPLILTLTIAAWLGTISGRYLHDRYIK